MKKVDAIILLGGGTDGTLRPVLYTKERLEQIPHLHKHFSHIPLIVSGGYSAWMKKPRYTEAEVMKRYLIHHRFLSKDVLLEKRSRDTIGNAYYSKQIIKKHPAWKNLMVITTSAHIGRSRWIFKKIFGKKYTITFLGLPSKIMAGHGIEKRRRYETYVTLLYKVWLVSARDGDDKRIMHLLKKFHPTYSNSHLASEIREKILSAKQRLLGYTKLS